MSCVVRDSVLSFLFYSVITFGRFHFFSDRKWLYLTFCKSHLTKVSRNITSYILTHRSCDIHVILSCAINLCELTFMVGTCSLLCSCSWICWQTDSHCFPGKNQGWLQQKIWWGKSCNSCCQQPEQRIWVRISILLSLNVEIGFWACCVIVCTSYPMIIS